MRLATAVERVGGLQTQYAPTAYIGLWSRLERFRRDDLTRALERRTVMQGTLMRATIHIVSARDYPLFAEAVRGTRREWWLSATRRRDQGHNLQAVARRLRALLAEGPRRRDELIAELGVDTMTWNGVQMWVDLVRVPPSGTWERRRADVFALAEDWLGRASTVRSTTRSITSCAGISARSAPRRARTCRASPVCRRRRLRRRSNG